MCLYTLRHPGIEPGPHAWEARILTTELMALILSVCKKDYTLPPGLEPGTYRLTADRSAN